MGYKEGDEWTNYYKIYLEKLLTHPWEVQVSYNVMVIVEDKDRRSQWSDTLPVTAPFSKRVINEKLHLESLEMLSLLGNNYPPY